MNSPAGAGARYMVTGGAGFIGSTLIRQIIADSDDEVINIDKLTYAGNLESLGAARDNSRHTFAQVDICDAPAIARLFMETQPTGVFHLAAESHVDRSIDGPDDFLRTNVQGTYTLLQESLRYWGTLAADRAAAFRFVHASTDEVFGSAAPDELFHATSRYDPSSPYSASKAASDHLVRAWHRTYGLPVIVTSSSNNYGPCQFPEKLIPLMIVKALAGEAMPLYGIGDQERDWLHVDDHARMLRLAMAHGKIGENYLGGTGIVRRNTDVVTAICNALDLLRPDAAGSYRRLITQVADRPGHDFRYAIDAAPTRAQLSWEPRVKFEVGLQETVAWYLANGEWLSRVMSGAYRGERLGAP